MQRPFYMFLMYFLPSGGEDVSEDVVDALIDEAAHGDGGAYQPVAHVVQRDIAHDEEAQQEQDVQRLGRHIVDMEHRNDRRDRPDREDHHADGAEEPRDDKRQQAGRERQCGGNERAGADDGQNAFEIGLDLIDLAQSKVAQQRDAARDDGREQADGEPCPDREGRILDLPAQGVDQRCEEAADDGQREADDAAEHILLLRREDIPA
mgnify:CR=1 FL=1